MRHERGLSFSRRLSSSPGSQHLGRAKALPSLRPVAPGFIISRFSTRTGGSSRAPSNGCSTTVLPIEGASDHGVSEAIYLRDPDGNGIELYRDRPREEWPRVNGELRMTTRALDLDGLLAELHDFEPEP